MFGHPLAAMPTPLIYISAAGAMALLVFGFMRLARARSLADVPLSRIRSAAQGQLELLGRARLLPGPKIFSPITKTPCVWWRYRITVDNEDNSGVVAAETSEDLFQLVDTTGSCIVDPVGATVEPAVVLRWQGPSKTPLRIPQSRREAARTRGNFRFTEELIPLEALIVVQGWFRTQSAVYGAEESRDVGALLAEWKEDRRSLLRRFDLNHDGQIDPQEWELARAAALEEVRQKHAEQVQDPDLNVLCNSPDHREFLISAIPREALVERYRRQGWLLLMGTAIAAAVVLTALHAHRLI